MGYKCKFKLPEMKDIVEAKPVKWNITIGKEHKPMRAYKIVNCVHTDMYEYGDNNYYAADASIPQSELTTDDLYPLVGEVCWSYTVNQENFCGPDGITTVTSAKIFCAGEQIYEFKYGWSMMPHKIMTIIHDLKKHPIDFEYIDYEKEIIGRKIWWNDQPAIITEYRKQKGTVTIEPMERENFKLVKHSKKETCLQFIQYAQEGRVTDDILSSDIRWFRAI